MFGRSAGGADDRVGTIIARDTELKGKITGNGSLRIDGRVEGDVHCSGDVYVGETAQVTAGVKARNLTVAGEIHGDIEASGRVELLRSGRLYGDLKAKSLVVSEGAVFQGTSHMTREEAARATQNQRATENLKAEIA